VRLALAVCLLGAALLVLPAAPAGQSFTGVVTDSMCDNGDHSAMRMGPTDAECTLACVSAHGAVYVLWTGKETWQLSDQKTPEKFAGKKVRVTGTPDPKKHMIQVDSMVLSR
jgi:hypothetical protein